MIALLLALTLPPIDTIPAVESLEANFVVRPVRKDPEDWHTQGWEPAFGQLIVREIHYEGVEISGFVMWHTTPSWRVHKDGAWWILVTNQGTFKSKVYFETWTDYDVEVEERLRFPSELRKGLPHARRQQ